MTAASDIRNLTSQIESLSRDLDQHSRKAARGVSVYQTPAGDRRWSRMFDEMQRLSQQRFSIQRSYEQEHGVWLGDDGEPCRDEDDFDSWEEEDD